jgi:hypothetical protein
MILLSALLILPGCRREPAAAPEKVAPNGTAELMDQVARAPKYKPPADRRLTERQVRMYLDVRLREQKIREAAFNAFKRLNTPSGKERRPAEGLGLLGSLGDLADMGTADLRASRELGFNPKEYQWVRERVMDAQMLQATQALNRQVALSREALLRSLEEEKKTAGAAQRAGIDRNIRDLRNSAAGVADRDPAKIFNAGLLVRYQEDFARLRGEEQRIGQELLKGTSHGH